MAIGICSKSIGNHRKCGLAVGHYGACRQHVLVVGGQSSGGAAVFDNGGFYTVEVMGSGYLEREIVCSAKYKQDALDCYERITKGLK